MKDLIEALGIFLKYMKDDVHAPTHCEHDELFVCVGVKPSEMDADDVKRLDKLGFFYAEDDENWRSFRFGSC